VCVCYIRHVVTRRFSSQTYCFRIIVVVSASRYTHTYIYITYIIRGGSVFAPFSRRLSQLAHQPVTPLSRRLYNEKTRVHTHTHGRAKRPVREGAAVCPYCDALYIYGRCRRRHCYEGAFRDVTLNPKYKCKILLKSPDTGAPPVVPLLCYYIYIYIYTYCIHVYTRYIRVSTSPNPPPPSLPPCTLPSPQSSCSLCVHIWYIL